MDRFRLRLSGIKAGRGGRNDSRTGRNDRLCESHLPAFIELYHHTMTDIQQLVIYVDLQIEELWKCRVAQEIDFEELDGGRAGRGG